MTSYPNLNANTSTEPIRDGLRRALTRRYGRIALPWAKLGFAVVPATLDGKAPAVETFEPWASGKRLRPRVRISYEQVVEWSDSHLGCNRGLLLLDSHPENRLVVVDVDDPTWWSWVTATFGDTPLKVWSGRNVPEGTDRPGHAYYRAPKGLYVAGRNGFVGPPKAFRWPEWPEAESTPPKHWGTSPIDVKCGGNYVVAPGSVHKTGREYTSTVPIKEITPEFLASLPLFDLAAYETMSAAAKAERRRRKIKRLGLAAVPEVVKRVIRQHLAGEIDGGTPVRLADGTSGRLAEVAANLQPGGATVSAFCPEHRNDDTPAASVGRGHDGRPFLRCFGSCSTTFRVPGLVLGPGLHEFGFDHGDDERRERVERAEPMPTSAEKIAAIKTEEAAADAADPYCQGIRKAIDRLEEKHAKTLSKRRVAAECPPAPEVVELARRADAKARELAEPIQAEWRAAGFDRRGERCGTLPQGLGCAASGRATIVARPCHRIACIYCGPLQVARQVVAATWLPALNPERQIIGGALRHREAWVYTFPTSSEASWLRRWRRAAVRASTVSVACAPAGGKNPVTTATFGSMSALVTTPIVEGDLSDQRGHGGTVVSMVAPDPQGARAAPVDIYRMPVPRPLLGADPVEDIYVLVRIGDDTHVVTSVQLPSGVQCPDPVATLTTWLRKAYAVEPDTLGGITPSPKSGHVRASTALTTDPKVLLALCDHKWVVERTNVCHPARAARLRPGSKATVAPDGLTMAADLGVVPLPERDAMWDMMRRVPEGEPLPEGERFPKLVRDEDEMERLWTALGGVRPEATEVLGGGAMAETLTPEEWCRYVALALAEPIPERPTRAAAMAEEILTSEEWIRYVDLALSDPTADHISVDHFASLVGRSYTGPDLPDDEKARPEAMQRIAAMRSAEARMRIAALPPDELYARMRWEEWVALHVRAGMAGEAEAFLDQRRAK